MAQAVLLAEATRVVVFADLRGSTSLYERWGNATATRLVTGTVAALAEVVEQQGGRVVKTLGDGLMAVFPSADSALVAAAQMHRQIDGAPGGALQRSAPRGPGSLCLQISASLGPVTAVDTDVFGDAVNVAARLLDHAGDGETVITEELHTAASAPHRLRFRRLDRLRLRGRAEAVQVYVSGGRPHAPGLPTVVDGCELPVPASVLLLSAHARSLRVTPQDTPVVLGRGANAQLAFETERVSRLHARIDWHGSGFHLTDLSANGTEVHYAGGQVLSLRRTSCSLQGRGTIVLAGSATAANSAANPPGATITFDILDEAPR